MDHRIILVLGTDSQCGKTVLTAGLAVVFTQAGFRMQAFKPLSFVTDLTSVETDDQAFLNQITQQYIQVNTLSVPSAWEVTPLHWNKIITQCQQFPYPCLLEGPGQIATPWRRQDHLLKDALDVAATLEAGIILVGKAEPMFLEKMLLAIAFAQARAVQILGFASVFTQPSQDEDVQILQDAWYLAQQTGVAFLGIIPYSPSIQVHRLNQGNLVTLTQNNIDLLPLQMRIGVTL